MIAAHNTVKGVEKGIEKGEDEDEKIRGKHEHFWRKSHERNDTFSGSCFPQA